MAKNKNLSYNDIPDKNEDWGLDPRNGFKYSGESVQKFIKETFDSKMGYFHYDTSSNRYLVFADEASKNEYVENPTLTELVLGSFDAPFNYEASITMLTPSYNAVFLGSNGNYLDFTFDVKNKAGNSTGENVTVTYTFIRNATKKVLTETRRYGETVHFNIDDYLLEGTNTIIVGISGQTTLAATTAALTYQVVNLSYSDEMNIARVYDLSQGAYTMEVFFNVSGYGTKIVEWFLDGNQLEFVKSEDEVVDVTAQRTKYIELSNLTSGIHTIQSRAYTLVNGEKFYTDTLYREIMVNNGDTTANVVAVAANVPHSHGIVTGSNPFLFYGVEQYIPYEIRFATRKTGNVSVYLSGELAGTLTSSANTESRYSVTSNKAGTLSVKFSVDGVEREIPLSVNKTSLNIEEIKTSLSFDFRATGKSNTSVDKDVWSYGDYTATFEGFNWNASSGWVDNSLLINNGASFSVDIAPLAKDATSTGKTLEFEFSTRNVENDDAVICDLTTNGKGLLITASEARLTSAAGEVVSTRFKAGEVNRIAFVINRKTGVTYKGLVFIYVNGILSGAVNYGSADNFTSTKQLMFVGTEDAQVELRAMRFYDTALSADNVLNNYVIYRDTLNEMMEVYYRNEIYAEGTQSFSPDAMLHRLPVMVITGDIPTLEAATSTSTQILVDIDYTNEQDPTKNFKMKNAALRIQGTSSLAYPRKNFRFYTQKEASTIVYDSEGKKIENKLYSFKDGAQPVDCWCLKADFAESSGTHNTAIARLWNKAMYGAIIQHKNVLGEEVNGYALRTNAQIAALNAGYEYDVRTTIDGFPIVLFYKKNASDTDLIFLGKYNFNNDKSTPSVFGFENIPDFDNSRMQCWETKDNGHPLGLFTDVSRFDADWSEAFESRYPDTKTPNTADLKAFSVWMNGVSQSDFITQKWAHFDVYKVAAYYCYLMRFGAVDQPVKNAFITSEDGEKFYFINYDNDTINGLINTGRLALDPSVNRDTIGSDGEYVYAGHNSVLWNRFTNDAEFMEIVSLVDNALYSAGLRYDEVIAEFNEGQADKWVERVYNQDAEYKYLLPYVNQATNNLFMLQGARSSHRSWWLSKRFSLYDSLFLSGAYRDRNISFKCLNDTQPNQEFTITAATKMNYGYGVNNGIRETGVEVDKGGTHTFVTTDTLNLGDVVKVFASANLEALDLSKLADRLAVLDCSAAADPSLGTKMKRLILGGAGKVNTELAAISGINVLASLQELNVEGYKNMTTLNLTAQKDLRKVFAKGSSVASIDFAAGAPVEHLELPSAMMALNFNQLPYLTFDNLVFESGLANIHSLNIYGCPNLTNDFSFIREWLDVKNTTDLESELYMDNIDWNGVSGAELARIAQFKNVSLKGRISLTDITPEQGEIFGRFGDNIFNENSDLYIDAPVSVTIYGDDSVLEGDTKTYYARTFPIVDGSMVLSFEGTRDGVSFDTSTGVLTTTENGLETSDVTIKAVFTENNGNIYESIKSVSIVKRTYPSQLLINGDANLKSNTRFDWVILDSDEDVNGIFYMDWAITGELASYYSVQKYDGYCILNQDKTPPTSLTGTLSLMVKKVIDDSITSSTSINVSFAYIYPSSVDVDGKTSIIGGSSEIYSATITPSNIDIGVSYNWSIKGSSNVFVESTNGSTCTLGTNVPTQEESFTLTCTVKSSDNKVSITKSINGTLKMRVNYITATYNVTSASQAHLLYQYYKKSNIEYMEIDGEVITDFVTVYQLTTGVHTAKFTLKTLEDAFRNCEFLTTIDFSECNGLIYENMEYACYGCSSLSSVIWGECYFTKTKSVTGLFTGCSQLTSIEMSPFRNAPITSLQDVFLGCFKINSINLSGLENSPIARMDNTFKNCYKLITIDLSPLSNAPLTSLISTFEGSSLKSIDLSILNFSSVTSISYMLSDTDIESIDLTPLSNSKISSLSNAFSKCNKLSIIDLTPLKGLNITKLGSKEFYGCDVLHTIIIPWSTAPSVSATTFGDSVYYYTGRDTYKNGTNQLIVPANSTGYDQSYWSNVLCDSTKCGFTLKNSYIPLECTDLVITADNVTGNDTTTKIYWTAITNGINGITEEPMYNVEVTGTATSETFPQNTSETEEIEREISFTYMGITATTMIIQGVWIDSYYTINLNNQWRLSTSVTNPDPALYDGVYESFSNKGKDDTEARMYINIKGYNTFKLYIRSDAESSYDYLVVSHLDASLVTNPSSDDSNIKAHTSNKQNSGTTLSSYTLVEYTLQDYEEHLITIVYRKDKSSASGEDRGYILIPKNQ